MLPVNKRTILDLCGGTGAWSRPYAEAGYNVIIVTLPEWDVRSFEPPENVYGILAAPPCDHFAVSGAQYWKEKDRDGRTADALLIADACFDIIEKTKPVFWCIENPIGRFGEMLRHRLYYLGLPGDGDPSFVFDPWEFAGWSDDPQKETYTKRTLLWGNFWPPKKKPVEIKHGEKYKTPIWKVGGKSERTKRIRSITPQGFARAFFEANR